MIELLVVVGLMLLLSALSIPAFNSLTKGNELNTATASIAALLEQARAQAMANNTYVVLCFLESDAAVSASQTQGAGTGRVTIQAFASRDGTLNLAAANLAPLGRPRVLDNVDMPASLGASTGTLGARPTANYVVGSPSFPTGTGTVAAGRFTFSKMIAFDPQGIIHLPTNPPQTGLQYLEIDVQPSNGRAAQPGAKNLSAIQVDGMTGAVTIYRS